MVPLAMEDLSLLRLCFDCDTVSFWPNEGFLSLVPCVVSGVFPLIGALIP